MATILVVDDRAMSRQFLVALLSNAGHRVLEAADGAQALAVMEAELPDLVISDILMPTLDGFELVRRMRADPATAATPVIFHTAAYRLEEARPDAAACGVRRVLVKPSEPDQILEAVNDALGLLPGAKAAVATPGPYAQVRQAAGELGDQLSVDIVGLRALSHKITATIARGLEVMDGRLDLAAMAEQVRSALLTLQGLGLRLTAVMEAGLEMAAQREPEPILAIGCRAAQDVIDARYAGIAIVDPASRELVCFESRGLSGRSLGRLPPEGIVGRVLSDRRPIRLERISGGAEALGLPAGHPPVQSLLVVPVVSPARVHGFLYLADRLGAEGFSEDDERIALTLAAQLALAYDSVVLVGETRRQAEALRDAEERLERIVSSSPAVTYVLRVDGGAFRASWVSANVEGLLGYPVASAMAPGWWVQNLHPADLGRAAAEVPKLFAEGRLTREFRFRRADGSWRFIHDEQRLLRDPRGAPVEVVGSWSDVTEKQALETQLFQAQKMESVGRLAGGIAHDFNNLLGVITGFGQMLGQRLPPGDERLRRWMDGILGAADRAAGLTRQLLAFSRQQVLKPRILDLNAVVAEAETLLRRMIGEDVELRTRLTPGLGSVQADPGQIAQVLMNLAVNARDAMPQGGRLTIETAAVELDAEYAKAHPTARPGRYAMLAVSDTGEGMTPEVQARVFEPFFTTKEAGKGTGLGLSTVYGIVKQTGGNVWVYSEPGRGTTFKIYLPLVETKAPDAAVDSAPSAQLAGTETILLVEDEAAIRAVTTELLGSLGYTVLPAANGAAALELAGRHGGAIDLLVTDVIMPGMPGRELAERLKAARPGLKILYISGYTDDAVVLHGVRVHEMAFLQKPFTLDALAQAVRAALEG